MASKIGKIEWKFVYGTAILIDFVQLVLGFTLVGIAVNEAIDPFIGAGFAVYFQLRGVSMITHFKRLASLVGVTVVEEITGGFAPAWILDVWYIHGDVMSEGGVNIKESLEVLSNIRQPLNQGGIRLPKKQ